MPWGRVDDTYYDHPKLERLTDEHAWPDRLAAAGLNALAWSWCNRFLTDGHIARGSVARLGGTLELADLLVSVGLWEATSSGYLVHDFLAFNDSREQVLARRQKEAERKAAWRLSHRDTTDAKPGPGGTTSGTSSVDDASVPHHVPPSVPAGQGGVSRRPSRDSHARTIARIPTRPDPTRPNVEIPPPPAKRGRRKDGTNPRATGAAPRDVGDNPRASGTSARQEREDAKRGPTRLGDVLAEVARREGIALPSYVRPSEAAAETEATADEPPDWARPLVAK